MSERGGRAHWFFCRAHQTAWWAGENLFRAGRTQTPEERASVERELEAYEEIAPYYHPPQRELDQDRLKRIEPTGQQEETEETIEA